MNKILYIHPKRASFIERDLLILSKHFKVTEATADWTSKIKLPFLLMQQLCYLIFNIRHFDAVVISFGGYWSFFPSIIGKLFKVPTYIILNGTDCVGFKEINYGNLRKPHLRWIIKQSYHFATKLLPVSSSLVYTENTYYNQSLIIQGYKHFFPEINTEFETIPNVFNKDKWKINLSIDRLDNRFVTVFGPSQFYNKGGDLLIEIAKLFPELEFYFVGLDKPCFLKQVPSNIRFLGRLNAQELNDVFNSATYYLQLSVSEGFGCALCEAMLSGCVPIVSSVNSLPDIIGDSGYVLEYRNIEKLIDLVLKIIKGDNSALSMKARNQIIENYPISIRENAFLNLLRKSV